MFLSGCQWTTASRLPVASPGFEGYGVGAQRVWWAELTEVLQLGGGAEPLVGFGGEAPESYEQFQVMTEILHEIWTVLRIQTNKNSH